MSSKTNRITVIRKVSLRVLLFSRAEGTSANIPLARPEKNPLPSIPLDALLFSILTFDSLMNLD
jgi:hypothetical protein